MSDPDRVHRAVPGGRTRHRRLSNRCQSGRATATVPAVTRARGTAPPPGYHAVRQSTRRSGCLRSQMLVSSHRLDSGVGRSRRIDRGHPPGPFGQHTLVQLVTGFHVAWDPLDCAALSHHHSSSGVSWSSERDKVVISRGQVGAWGHVSLAEHGERADGKDHVDGVRSASPLPMQVLVEHFPLG
jgi:hypothetical protein